MQLLYVILWIILIIIKIDIKLDLIKLDKDKEKLPFKDNEFDFYLQVMYLNILRILNYFINELERLKKKNYLELSLFKLEDNFCFENKRIMNGKLIMMI